MELNLVVVTWDGNATPMQCVHFNEQPQFKILLFNYSGKETSNWKQFAHVDYYVCSATENKGQVFEAVYQFLKTEALQFKYIGFLDDDILFSISSFNEMLHIASQHKLNVFQPSIAKDSYFSHRKFVHQSGYYVSKTDWVEIMAPFYEQVLFEACQPYFQYAISGQGIDCYIMPCMQKIHKKEQTAVVHTSMIKHTRPIRTHLRTYSNGLTGDQEMELLKQKALQIIDNQEYRHLFPPSFKTIYLQKGGPLDYSLNSRLLQLRKSFQNMLTRLKEMAHFD